MGSINHGIQKLRAAEARRGARLLHRGEWSAAEIALNAGTIALTVCSYPTVKNVKTVVAKLKSSQAGASTVKINSGQTITIAAGDLFGSYSNVTAFNADDIQINDYSKFEFVIFTTAQLSAAELTAYSNGTMWDYDRPENLVLCMDGRARNHDPDNKRVLDVSGNGNHLTKGNGTGIGEPTKNKNLGYTLDGVDDYFQLPDRTGKYPYMYLQISGKNQWSTGTAIYDSIDTSGGFTGKVYAIYMFNSEPNPTQVLNLQLSINPNELGA